MMAKQSGFAKRLQAMQDARDREVRHQSRVFMLDMVTLALGRMGWREAKFKEFDKKLSEVTAEYSKEIVEDSRSDSDLWYSKDTIDRELAQYVGTMFVPYEVRYK